MIQGRCPICSKSYTIRAISEMPSFPFCSERCRTFDLGRWADGTYTIPAGPAKQAPEDAETASLPPAEEE